MNYFPKFKTISIIIISLIIIFVCAYFKSFKEGLTNNSTVILMGDSILDNSSFVPPGKSVYDNLKTKLSNVINLAKNGSTINDLYRQLDEISIDRNKTDTHIFISAGGNDILNKNKQLNSDEIKQLFDLYMTFLNALTAKLDNIQLNILNLYLPTNPRFLPYKTSVVQWNQLLKENSSKVGQNYTVVDVNELLKSPDDFIYDIEPSETASNKIAYLIYLTR